MKQGVRWRALELRRELGLRRNARSTVSPSSRTLAQEWTAGAALSRGGRRCLRAEAEGARIEGHRLGRRAYAAGSLRRRRKGVLRQVGAVHQLGRVQPPSG